MPDVRPKIHRPIHDKSHKISTIRIRKRSSYVERNNGGVYVCVCVWGGGGGGGGGNQKREFC